MNSIKQYRVIKDFAPDTKHQPGVGVGGVGVGGVGVGGLESVVGVGGVGVGGVGPMGLESGG